MPDGMLAITITFHLPIRCCWVTSKQQ